MLHIFWTFWHWNLQQHKTITSRTQVDMITGSPVPTCHWGSVVNAKQCGWTTDKAVVDVHRRIRCHRVLSTGKTSLENDEAPESHLAELVWAKKTLILWISCFCGRCVSTRVCCFHIIINISLFKAWENLLHIFGKDVPFEHAMIFWMKHLFQKKRVHTPAIYLAMESTFSNMWKWVDLFIAGTRGTWVSFCPIIVMVTEMFLIVDMSGACKASAAVCVRMASWWNARLVTRS